MVRVIEKNYRDEATRLLGPEGFDPRVLDAMRTVPRHTFVPVHQQRRAYDDQPVSIGFGQTISQPLIVALMTNLLKPQPDHVVLEVGTGSGYQAAVLAHLVRRVYTIEIVPPLAEQARTRLVELGYDNVEVRTGDGYIGWEEAGPFDGILVTATADHIPPRLVEQLKPGGRMVIPVGDRGSIQHLTLIEAGENGTVQTRSLLPVRFVPLTGR
jgi:protein-L-isoaspartate(D-aspartate) O-methyltransferase